MRELDNCGKTGNAGTRETQNNWANEKKKRKKRNENKGEASVQRQARKQAVKPNTRHELAHPQRTVAQRAGATTQTIAT